jgi:hypothetical protein
MKLIQQLIETVFDETGIQGIALRVSRNDDGWTAQIVEGDDVLLCPAGERYLLTNGNHTMADAIHVLEDRVRAGYALAEKYQTGN